jgi:HPr kinase/phosphorylase
MTFVTLDSIIEEFGLGVLSKNVSTKEIKFVNTEINRPALQLTGFYNYFECERLQIIGKVEHNYLEQMMPEQRRQIIKDFFDHQIPCLIICRSLEPFKEMLYHANKKNIPILRFEGNTSEFMSDVIKFLTVKLAPQITMHGVLIDIYGEGVLIIGESGVGKSETAVELIKRGHRLVADDAVEIRKIAKDTLIGSCPPVIKYFIELRGIGIIDVKQMFGVHSVKETQNIDLVISLEIWDRKKEYDRLGLEEEYMDILGNKVVCLNIPIRPGRNLAIICESAAINHRQKKMGYNAAKVLNERVIENMNRTIE